MEDQPGGIGGLIIPAIQVLCYTRHNNTSANTVKTQQRIQHNNPYTIQPNNPYKASNTESLVSSLVGSGPRQAGVLAVQDQQEWGWGSNHTTHITTAGTTDTAGSTDTANYTDTAGYYNTNNSAGTTASAGIAASLDL